MILIAISSQIPNPLNSSDSIWKMGGGWDSESEDIIIAALLLLSQVILYVTLNSS